MLVTFEVLKVDRSRDASEGQQLNMPSMFVTLEVSRGDTSRDVRDSHPKNI